VKEHKRATIASFHVVQPDPINLQKLPTGWIIALRFPGDVPIYDAYGSGKGSDPGKGR
jgi:hypothetical protein